MISVLTIIVIFCLINYYVKKDLFVTGILGLSLTFIYLINISDFSLKILTYQKNISLYIMFTLYMIIIFSFGILNSKLRDSYIREKTQDIFDRILYDKKIKILTLCTVGFFMYQTPGISIILLIFLGSFFRISKYNLLTLPFIYISFALVYNELVLEIVSQKGFGLIVLYLGIIYVQFIVAITIERFRNLKIKKKEILLDYSFFLMMFIVNVVVAFVVYNVVFVNQTLIISMIITLITSLYIITRFDMFINKEIKEKVNEDVNKLEKLQKLKLPYLIILIFLITYILSYIVLINSLVIGLVLLLILNIIYIKLSNSQRKLTLVTEEWIKFIVFAILVLINLVLIKEVLYINSQSLQSILDNYVLRFSNIISIIIIIQNYTFFPMLSIGDSISNALALNDLVVSKIILSVNIQLIISFINMYIVYFIFKIKKNEMVIVVTILLVFSFIMQVLIYLF